VEGNRTHLAFGRLHVVEVMGRVHRRHLSRAQTRVGPCLARVTPRPFVWRTVAAHSASKSAQVCSATADAAFAMKPSTSAADCAPAAGKVLGWPKRRKLVHAFLWE
jgi:hypothetical protein